MNADLVLRLAHVMADHIGHGMSEKCMAHAEAVEPIMSALEGALTELVPPMPPPDAYCHVGICAQDKCVNCNRIAAAHKALAMLKNPSGG